MRYILSMMFTGVFTLLISHATAQKFSNDKPITIENLSHEKVWQIAEMAMNDSKIPVGKIDFDKGVLMSDWIEWTAIAIQNHARLYFKYDTPNLELKIADREYKSDKGWSEAVGSLSKKNYAEYMQAVADRIAEINKDEALTKQAIKTSKLIPAFNPVNTVGDIVLTLMKTSYSESLPVLEFAVVNKAAKAVTVDIPTTSFKKSVNTGGNNFGSHTWSRPDEMARKATMQPGETLTLTVKYDYKWLLNPIPKLDFKVICSSAGSEKTELVSIYQIPLNDYVFIPEVE
jgi:hypothetical protein